MERESVRARERGVQKGDSADEERDVAGRTVVVGQLEQLMARMSPLIGKEGKVLSGTKEQNIPTDETYGRVHHSL